MLNNHALLQNRYLIVRLVAQGGMGAVYQAVDQKFDTIVALKQSSFTEEGLRKAFEREARMLNKLRHAALPVVIDYFAEGDDLFLVMQFIPGDDLGIQLEHRKMHSEPVGKPKPFDADKVMVWVDQLLDALDYLHTQEPQVIHRDIKPQNLKLTDRGQIILLDFGLAKGSATNTLHKTPHSSIFGYTPHYAPLEQIRDKGTDVRSDLYSLGATFYHLITGVIPPDALTRGLAVANGEPDPLVRVNELNEHISPPVAVVIHEAMTLYKEQRPPSADAMRQLLRKATEYPKPSSYPKAIIEDQSNTSKGSTIVETRNDRDAHTTVVSPYAARLDTAQPEQARAATYVEPAHSSAAKSPEAYLTVKEPRAPFQTKKRKALPWMIGGIVVVLVVSLIIFYEAKRSSGISGIVSDLMQILSPKPKYILTKQDMEVLFQEMIPPDKQQEIAANPEEKKKLIDQIKKLLAVAQVADEEGYSQRPEVKAQTEFQTDLHLNQAYRKKHPETTVSDDQINAYHQSHPNDFDNFLKNNPQFQERAQGPQREQFRKQYGEFKVMADLARKENLEDDSLTKLGILLDRCQILQNAYLTELGKNADSLMSDREIEQYYNDHKNDFEEIRVRHVLVSTQPPPPDADAPADKDGKDKPKPKQLTKEEARRKAQTILERVRKGEDFAKLAKENSDDPASKDKGGEYDFFSHGRMVPEFENAAFALKPGEISDLVETPFGFHIIKLEERRPSPPPSDPKVRQQITDKMKEQKLNDRIDEIARKSKIVVPEDFDTTVKPASQAQPGAPVQGNPSIKK